MRRKRTQTVLHSCHYWRQHDSLPWHWECERQSLQWREAYREEESPELISTVFGICKNIFYGENLPTQFPTNYVLFSLSAFSILLLHAKNGQMVILSIITTVIFLKVKRKTNRFFRILQHIDSSLGNDEEMNGRLWGDIVECEHLH